MRKLLMHAIMYMLNCMDFNMYYSMQMLIPGAEAILRGNDIKVPRASHTKPEPRNPKMIGFKKQLTHPT